MLELVPEAQRPCIHNMYCLIEPSSSLLLTEVQEVLVPHLIISIEILDVEVLLLLRNLIALDLPEFWLFPVKVKIFPIAEVKERERPYEFSLALAGNLRPYILVVS